MTQHRVDHLIIGAGFAGLRAAIRPAGAGEADVVVIERGSDVTGGCASRYLDEHGHHTTLWPRATFTSRALTRSFDVAAHTVASPVTDSHHHREVVSA